MKPLLVILGYLITGSLLSRERKREEERELEGQRRKRGSEEWRGNVGERTVLGI